MPWLLLRLRFFRRKWDGADAGRHAAGEQLLALRALANRPLAKLAAINADPVGAWRAKTRWPSAAWPRSNYAPPASRGSAASDLCAFFRGQRGCCTQIAGSVEPTHAESTSSSA